MVLPAPDTLVTLIGPFAAAAKMSHPTTDSFPIRLGTAVLTVNALVFNSRRGQPCRERTVRAVAISRPAWGAVSPRPLVDSVAAFARHRGIPAVLGEGVGGTPR